LNLKKIKEKIPTWPLFRFAERNWYQTWKLAPFYDDNELRKNFKLAGQGRDASALNLEEQIDLYTLLNKSRYKLSEKDRNKEINLLSKVSYRKYLGIIDIDVNTNSTQYDKEKSKALAKNYAEKLASKTIEFGLGNPRWFSTSEKGGFHAELICDVTSDLALEVLKNKITILAKACGIPLYSELHTLYRKSYKKIDVYIDDTVLNRRSWSRGGQWRLPSVAKPEGEPKTLVSLSSEPYSTIPANPFLIDIKNLVKEKEELVEFRKRSYNKSYIVNIDHSIPITQKSLDVVASYPELNNIWYKIDKQDRSRRDFEFALRACSLGLDENNVTALLKEMPGSKAGARAGDIGYFDSVFRSVNKTLKNPYLKPLYAQDLVPRNLLISEKEFLKELLKETGSSSNKKLKSILNCGRVAQIAVDLDDRKEYPTRVFRCEKAICPFCGPKRIHFQLENAQKKWPDTLVTLFIPTDFRSCQELFLKFKKELRAKLGREKLFRKIISKLRTYRSPEGLFIISEDKRLHKMLTNSVLLNKAETLLKVKELLGSPLKRFEEYIKTKNLTGILTDPWIIKSVSYSSGRKNKLKWLAKKELRTILKIKANELRTYNKDFCYYSLVNRFGSRYLIGRIKPHSLREIKTFLAKERELYNHSPT